MSVMLGHRLARVQIDDRLSFAGKNPLPTSSFSTGNFRCRQWVPVWLGSSILMGVPASIKRSAGKNHYRLTLRFEYLCAARITISREHKIASPPRIGIKAVLALKADESIQMEIH